VKDRVRLVHQLTEQGRVEHVRNVVAESLASAQVRNVAHRPGREVVDDMDIVAARQQRLGEMGSYEAGTAGDEILQG
jgi:hypothetical protein